MIDSQKSKYTFDRLRMYFGEPYEIKSNDTIITIYSPTLGDILECGESHFYSMLYTFIGNPTMYRLQLWDLNVDWNKISDYELFCTLIKTVNNDISKYVFGDINFQSFDLYNKTEKNVDGEEIQTPTLYSQEHNLEISENVYLEIREYLRLMFNIYPKVEKAKGKTTKEWMIEEERNKLESEKNNPKSTSTLLPLVSFCVNHPGFKYKTKELKEIGIVQFMDSVQRLQIYESTRALNSGLYCGMADLSKVSKDQFNFMRDVEIK